MTTRTTTSSTVSYNDKAYTIHTTIEGKYVLTDSNPALDGKKLYIKKGIAYEKNVPLHRTIISRRAVFLNGITTDCRKANLTPFKYDPVKSKGYRNDKLPIDCGVSPQEVPGYMWYDGERKTWTIKIKNKFHWKSSDSDSVSIKCKFEMAKKVYRDLLKSHPGLGKQDTKAERLKDEYYTIFELASIAVPPRKTVNLQEDLTGLGEEEVKLVSQE
jgi:hypothetical protein